VNTNLYGKVKGADLKTLYRNLRMFAPGLPRKYGWVRKVAGRVGLPFKDKGVDWEECYLVALVVAAGSWDRTRGTKFSTYFACILKNHLYDAVRDNQRYYDRHVTLDAAKNARLPAQQDSTKFREWNRLVLALVMPRLNRTARNVLCLRRERGDMLVRDEAAALGVSEKTVWNVCSGNKLGKMVRDEAQAMFRELSPGHQHLLARHLDEELELGEPEKLFGEMPDAKGAPLLHRNDLLDRLGWSKQ
jgi:DNA-directed RNA polymerase specialized sigma24 family protein